METTEFTSRGDALLVPDGSTVLVCGLHTRTLARIPADILDSVFPILETTEQVRDVAIKYTDDIRRAWRGFSTLMLLVTRRCNLKCIYCYASAGISGPQMPTELALNATEQYFKGNPSSPSISFHGGGEPTLNIPIIKAVYQRAQELTKGPCRFGIVTNGTCSERALAWLVERKFDIMLSWDGPREIQDRNRPFATGRPSSEHLERTAAFLSQHNHPFVVRSTISANDDIPTLVDYFARHGVRTIKLEPLYPHGREYPDAPAYDIPPPSADDLVRITLTALDICQARGITFSCTAIGRDGLPAWHGPTFCGNACARTMVVTHEGQLSACTEVVDSKDVASNAFLFGCWTPQEHRFTITTERLGNLLKRHVARIPECKLCPARFTCGGGCAIKAYRASGSLSGLNPINCEFQAKIIPQLIKRVARLRGI